MKTWLTKRLVSTDQNGDVFPPGGGRSAAWLQEDGGQVAITAHGDAFDLYIGKKQIYNIELDLRVGLKLGWWIVRWWVFGTWFGVKLILWRWSLKVGGSRG